MRKPHKGTTGAGLLLLARGKVLLVRVGYGPAKGKWIAPGGLVERGESPRRAAARELYEETGLKVRPARLVALRHQWKSKGAFDVYMVFSTRLTAALEIPKTSPGMNTGEILQARWWNVPRALASRRVRPMTRKAIRAAMEPAGRSDCLLEVGL